MFDNSIVLLSSSSRQQHWDRKNPQLVYVSTATAAPGNLHTTDSQSCCAVHWHTLLFVGDPSPTIPFWG